MRNLLVKVFILIALSATAASAQFKTIDLKPIQKHGFSYYYNFKKVSSAQALQIPLQEMGDERINKYYRTFTSLQMASGLVFLVPLVYALYNAQGVALDTQTFWGLTVGAIGLSVGMEIWSHNRIKLAIDRYNTLLLPHPAGRAHFSGQGLSLHVRLD